MLHQTSLRTYELEYIRDSLPRYTHNRTDVRIVCLRQAQRTGNQLQARYWRRGDCDLGGSIPGPAEAEAQHSRESALWANATATQDAWAVPWLPLPQKQSGEAANFRGRRSPEKPSRIGCYHFPGTSHSSRCDQGISPDCSGGSPNRLQSTVSGSVPGTWKSRRGIQDFV